MKIKNLIGKLGAAFMAGLCAFSMLGSSVSGIITASVANSSTENSAFPSADTVIAKAATLLGSPYTFGNKGYWYAYNQGEYTPLSVETINSLGIDCSGLVYYTLTQLGYSTNGFSWNNPVPVDTAHWLSVNENCTITYKGVTSKVDVQKQNVSTNDRPYWERSDGSTITPGSVVVADKADGIDHAWIYMGEFESRDDVISYLKSIGVSESLITSETVGDGSGDGGTHWRIESNGTEGVVVNNKTDGKTATAMNMSAFRITQSDVKFEILKVDSETGAVIGKSPVDNSSAVYGVYSDEACTRKVGEITIGSDGKGSVMLPGGRYYAKELKAPTGYEVDGTVYAISANQTTTVRETAEKGTIKVIKTAEDNIIRDIEFKVTGSDGSTYTKNTDSKGIAEFSGLKVYDMKTGELITYTVSEQNVPAKYVAPANQTVTLTADETTTKTFKNTLKKFTVEVTKQDSETVSEQGDGSLAGAVYGIYRDGELMDTYTTDENGYFKTKEYICGDYTVGEISPSEGYLLDEREYNVGAEAGNFTLENNSVSMTVTEDVVKGNIAIIKHSDNGSTQIETPEAGAEFEVYLKSAGSYENAKDSEKDYLVCDENGFAQTKLLPFGIYTVHQTKGAEGAELMENFEVNISKNGHTYRYLINNSAFESYVKVVKTDWETGKTIPCEGTGFEIYDSDGQKISMTFNYPTPTTIDVFYTNNEGYLITPEALPCGEYSLVEVQAPYGYVLDSTPVNFSITTENADKENALSIVKVEKKNTSQKGRISVRKTGDIFSSVTAIKNGQTTYTPVFEEKGLAGSVFEVTAAEDIITPDGTIRANAGDVVAQLTTDENGYAQSGLLYLGEYEIKEISAPEGYVLNGKSQFVELTYAGQEIAVLDTVNTSFVNDYQGVEITLSKVMENDDLFGIYGKDCYASVRFGLFAAEDITAADGSVIPEDGLICEVGLDENMTAKFNTALPFGRYYVREIATDEHYILNGEKYLVNFEYMGQEVTTVSIDCGKFENSLKRGKIQGVKVNESDEPLENALFGLFAVDTAEFTSENAYMTAKSDENGYFEFNDVPLGEYVIHEIKAPTGYILSDESYPAAVREDGETIEIRAFNRSVVVEISKVDIYGSELEGAKLQLVDGSGKIIDQWISDGENHIVSGLAAGKYILKEIAAPQGYAIASDIKFTVDEHGNVDVESAESTAISDNGNPLIVMTDKALPLPETPDGADDVPHTGTQRSSMFTISALIAAAVVCSKKKGVMQNEA